MKHLKKYKTFESGWSNRFDSRPKSIQESEFEKKAEESYKVLSSVKNDVEDILLEVSDEGFDVHTSINRWHKNEPHFTYGGLHDGWISELRYIMVIHIVKKGLRPGQSMFANTNYFDINTIKEPLIRLEGYVKENLPGYKMEYSDGVDKAWKENRISRISLVTISIDNYKDGVEAPQYNKK